MTWKRLWPIALGLLTALVLVVANSESFKVPQQALAQTPELLAQTSRPSPEASPTASPSPEASPQASPSPEASPQASPSPEASPQASPVPAAPATTPTVVPQDEEATPVTLSEETYTDPGNRFQVGILAEYAQEDNVAESIDEDNLQPYTVSAVGGIPLIESPDGNLAYTVVVKPRATAQRLSNEDLAQMAIEVFEQGEGFKPEAFEAQGTGEILIPWTGMLNNTQSMGGVILARQSDRSVYLLLISATEKGASKVEPAIGLLSDTLQAI